MAVNKHPFIITFLFPKQSILFYLAAPVSRMTCLLSSSVGLRWWGECEIHLICHRHGGKCLTDWVGRMKGAELLPPFTSGHRSAEHWQTEHNPDKYKVMHFEMPNSVTTCRVSGKDLKGTNVQWVVRVQVNKLSETGGPGWIGSWQSI